MNYTLLELPIVLPVLFWAVYHYYKDRNLPEPLSLLALAFLLGAAAAGLAMLMYQSLDLIGLRFDAYALAEANPAGLLAYAILVIGLLEETAKLIPFLLFVVRFRDFDEPVDGIIYGSFIALGFAAVENVQYVQAVSNAEAFARGFAGPVVHIVFTSIWAFFIGRAYLCGRRLAPTVLTTLAISAVLHGIYDFIVIALPSQVLPAAALLILAIWLWRLRLISDLHALPPGPCPEEAVTRKRRERRG